jgi:LCP family protein required for cell wall assembly
MTSQGKKVAPVPLKYRYLIGIMIVILSVLAYAFYLSLNIDTPPETSHNNEEENWIREKGRINILLLGTDQDLKTNSRTDTIILASLDTINKKVSLLSIPRDTRVNIPGFGENRINAANILGGVDLVKQTISGLINVPIDYYVITNFEGFKGIIDTLGGVEIDVEQNMKYRTYDGMIDLKKGVQRLDGEKALQYVRYRHDKLGDITRTQRQQKFLTALAKEMIQAKTIFKLPALLPKLSEAVNTDLSIKQMMALAKEFGSYDLTSITVQTLPGNFVDLNGASFWYVDPEKSRQVVMEVFAGKSTNIIDKDININSGSKSQAPRKKENPTDQSPQEEENSEPPLTNNPLPPEGDPLPAEDTISENEEENKTENDLDPENNQTENPDPVNSDEPEENAKAQGNAEPEEIPRTD